ncbi:hypothetical protein THAOC_10431, partial [Thalassiosira oceanica]
EPRDQDGPHWTTSRHPLRTPWGSTVRPQCFAEESKHIVGYRLPESVVVTTNSKTRKRRKTVATKKASSVEKPAAATKRETCAAHLMKATTRTKPAAAQEAGRHESKFVKAKKRSTSVQPSAPIEMAVDGGWRCVACSFQNTADAATKCLMCQTVRRN